jgi:hypothetical protein
VLGASSRSLSSHHSWVPRLPPRSQDRLASPHAYPPRVLVGAEPGHRRAVEHQGRGPLGIGGREQHRHRSALGEAHDRRALGAGRVHGGADVVHPRFEIGNPLRPVGHPEPALAEQDQPGDRGHAAVEVGGAALPRHAEVGQHPPADEHDVDRAVAGHAVGDVHVAAARVADLRALHRRILRLRPPPGKSKAAQRSVPRPVPRPIRRLRPLPEPGGLPYAGIVLGGPVGVRVSSGPPA